MSMIPYIMLYCTFTEIIYPKIHNSPCLTCPKLGGVHTNSMTFSSALKISDMFLKLDFFFRVIGIKKLHCAQKVAIIAPNFMVFY